MNRRDIMLITAAGVVIGLAGRLLRAYAEPTRRLVFIHGRGQQGKDPAALKAKWIAALQRGATSIGREIPSDLEVAFPFYGNVLDDYAQQFEIPLTFDIPTRGEVDQEFLQFQADFAESLRQQAGITDEQVNAEYEGEYMERGPQNWKWVQAILRALDKYSSGMSQVALEKFTRDVYLYVTRTVVRDSIDKIIQESLTDQPTLIVSHSLGTVVAYSVLRRSPSAERVPLLVTLGSPLAVRSVRNHFQPLKYPAQVGYWYNAFDKRDVVSLFPLDEANFPVQKAINNNSTVRNHTDNRHGIDGYLDDANVARRILDSLVG